MTLISGFNFTPATSGQTGPDNTTYTIGSASTGSINMSGVSINVSSSAAGSQAGNVLAVANGSVSLGTITATGSATGGTGGSVTIIGTGVSTGTINTSGSTSGDVA